MARKAGNAGSVCTHVQALTDWVPCLVAAQAMQNVDGLASDGLLCAVCCQLFTHAEQSRGQCSQGHHVGLELRTGRVHCLACRMCMTPEALIASKQAVHAAQRVLQSGITPSGPPPNDPAPQVLAKRRRMSKRLQQQRLEQEQQQHGQGQQGQQGPTPTTSISGNGQAIPGAQSLTGYKETRTGDGLPFGLRGLNNLGNTCFMNSVLQAFIHTPLVRLYYLGEGHMPSVCRWQSSRPCLACEMDTLFSSMYSGERQPFSPVDFLYAWWCQTDKLAEYQQQDAHEFYLSALSALSSNSMLTEPTTTSTSRPRPNRLSQSGQPAAGSTPTPASTSQHAAPSLDMGLGLGPLGSGVMSTGGRLPGGAPSTLEPPSAPSSFIAATGSHPGPTHGAGGVPATSTSTSEDQSGVAKAEVLGMVETVFGGLLRSDVRCSVCGHISTAYDPYLDLSLDMLAASQAATGHTDTQPDMPCSSAPTGHAHASQHQPTTRQPPHQPSPTPPSSMDNVSAAQGPQGKARGGGGGGGGGLHGRQSGHHPHNNGHARGTDGGVNGGGQGSELDGEGANPAGASESCSLGEHRAYPAHPSNHPQLTRRLSESSVQDDASVRVTPEISDVSSLLVVGDPATATGTGGGVGRGAQQQKPPAGPRHTPGRLSAQGGGTPGEGGMGRQRPATSRTARPEVSIEPAESQMVVGAVGGVMPPTWESPLDDSMSSPLQQPVKHAGHVLQQHQAAVPHQGGVPSADAVLMGLPQEGESPGTATVGDAMPRGVQGAAGGGGKKKGGRGGKGKVVDTRTVRCGECHTCLNRHLKKACLRNKALRDAGVPVPTTASTAAAGAQAGSPLPPVPETHPLLWPPDHSDQVQQSLAGAPNASQAPTGQARIDLSQCDNSVMAGGEMVVEVSAAGPVPSPLRLQLTPEPSDLGGMGMVEPEASSMIEEPACSHLALQTVAWPVGQGQHRVVGEDSKQEGGTAGEDEVKGGRAQHVTSASRPSSQSPPLSLEDCLSHFIQEEALHAGEAWVCSHCRRRQRASKQMSIRRLPPVLCLHVKRFEHALGSARVVRKLQQRLAFPTDTLDMTPYVTSTLLKQRYHTMDVVHEGHTIKQEPPTTPHHNRSTTIPPRPPTHPSSRSEEVPGGEGDLGGEGEEGELLYSLLSVICHKGDISGGHYVAYVRCCGSWFCCDDAWVTMVDEEEVAQCQAYMLFYTQSKYISNQVMV